MTPEINCTACGAITFLRKEPRYEGFKKVGEDFSCLACGHVYASEDEVPFHRTVKKSLFTSDDLSRKPAIFQASEIGHICRRCEHYTVNPFTQRCGLHNRIVEAMDVCSDFSAKKEEEKN
jgi:hypothetical protein